MTAAHISDTSGAYGDFDPSSSSSGPIRAPRIAPPRNPTSDIAPTISPWEYPQTPIASVNATMIQSMAVTAGGRVPPPRGRTNRPDDPGQAPQPARGAAGHARRALSDRRARRRSDARIGGGERGAATSPGPGSAAITARCGGCSRRTAQERTSPQELAEAYREALRRQPARASTPATSRRRATARACAPMYGPASSGRSRDGCTCPWRTARSTGSRITSSRA